MCITNYSFPNTVSFLHDLNTTRLTITRYTHVVYDIYMSSIIGLAGMRLAIRLHHFGANASNNKDIYRESRYNCTYAEIEMLRG